VLQNSNENVGIKFSAHDTFRNDLYQVRSETKYLFQGMYANISYPLSIDKAWLRKLEVTAETRRAH
jgi:hypothetical protein